MTPTTIAAFLIAASAMVPSGEAQIHSTVPHLPQYRNTAATQHRLCVANVNLMPCMPSAVQCIDVEDVLTALSSFQANADADVDFDGVTGVEDILLVLASYGDTLPSICSAPPPPDQAGYPAGAYVLSPGGSGKVAMMLANTRLFKNGREQDRNTLADCASGAVCAAFNAGDVWSGTVSSGDVFLATQPFTAYTRTGSGSGGHAYEMTPIQLKGTQFSITNNRRDPTVVHVQCLGAPCLVDFYQSTSDTNRNNRIAAAQRQASLTTHEYKQIKFSNPPQGNLKGGSRAIWVESTAPILLAVRQGNGNGGSNEDFMPVPPVSDTLYGVASQTLGTSLFAEGTGSSNIAAEVCSDGSNPRNHSMPPKGASKQQGGYQRDYRGKACRLQSTSTFGAESWADGDGSEGTAFLPTSLFSTHFVTPVTWEYMVFASNMPGNVTVGPATCQSAACQVTYPLSAVQGTTAVYKTVRVGWDDPDLSCVGANNCYSSSTFTPNPHKGTSGTNTNQRGGPAGVAIQSSVPVWAMLEAEAGRHDETNLYGSFDLAWDCANVLGGPLRWDHCGTCTDPSTACVQDCAGVWGGPGVADAAGWCYQDCSGAWAGAARIDACGVCDADSTNDCTRPIQLHVLSQGGTARVRSASNNNAVYLDGVLLGTLNMTDEWTGAVSSGQIFSADGPLHGTVRAGNHVLEMAPAQLQGTQFSIANNRRDPLHLFMRCMPGADCTVTLSSNDPNLASDYADLLSTDLIGGFVKEMSISNIDDGSNRALVVTSTAPLLVTVKGSNGGNRDYQPTPPDSTEQYGVPAGNIGVAQPPGNSNTVLQRCASGGAGQPDGDTNPKTINLRADGRSYQDGGYKSRFTGKACKYTSTSAFGAHTYADGDGSDGTPFLPVSLMSTAFVASNDFQHVNFASNQSGAIAVTFADGSTTALQLEGDNGVFYTDYRAAVNGQAGSTFFSNVPVWGVLECAVSNDEQLLYGNFGVVTDCTGALGGSAAVDNCGICAGGCTQDCAGVWGGASALDQCGACDATTANDCVADCAGTWGGIAYLDACNTCDTNTTNDCPVDCFGVTYGNATVDNCGTCNYPSAPDCVADCAGVWGAPVYPANATFDQCGACEPFAANFCTQDCAGVWGGASVVDQCGACVLPANVCTLDCAGIWGGTRSADDCGVCDTDPNNDCSGVMFLHVLSPTSHPSHPHNGTAYVAAMNDNTQIYRNGALIATKNAGQIWNGSVVAGDVISGSDVIAGAVKAWDGMTGHNGNGATYELVPHRLAGTQFSVGNNRRNPVEFRIRCMMGAQCEVTLFAAHTAISPNTYTLAPGEYKLVQLGTGFHGSTRAIVVSSTAPILLTVRQYTDNEDFNAYAPNSNTLYGIASTSGGGALAVSLGTAGLGDWWKVTETCSDNTAPRGLTTTYNMTAFGTSIQKTGYTGQYAGPACRLHSVSTFNAESNADNDGNDGTNFLPVSLFSTHFVTTVPWEFVAFASNQPGNVTVAGTVYALSGTPDSNTSTLGVYGLKVPKLSAGQPGDVIVSTVPVWAMQECQEHNEESVLYGNFDLGWDCAGVPYLSGTAPVNTVDNCDICTTPSFACTQDCAGVWGGPGVADPSDGHCINDCANTAGGPARTDDCGVCDTDPSNDCTRPFALTVLSPSGTAEVRAFSPAATIYKNGVAVANGTYSGAAIHGDVFSSQGIIYGKVVRSSPSAAWPMVPQQLQGTAFSIGQDRRNNFRLYLKCMPGPVGTDCAVTVSNTKGNIQFLTTQTPAASRQVTILAGEDREIQLLGNTKGANEVVVVTSTAPLLVGAGGGTGSNTGGEDYLVVPPDNTEFFGIPSNRIAVGDDGSNGVNSTTIYETCSNGNVSTITLLTTSGGTRSPSIGGKRVSNSGSNPYPQHFTGKACRYTSTETFGIHQFADGDGTDGVAFLPTSLFSSKFVAPVNFEFVAFASDQPGTITFTRPNNLPVITYTLGQIGVHNNTAYVAKTAGGNAGTVIESTVPVWAVFEDPGPDDESLFYGDLGVPTDCAGISGGGATIVNGICVDGGGTGSGSWIVG